MKTGHTKEKIITSIKYAEKLKLAEQDEYRAIIDRIGIEGWSIEIDTLKEMGWDGIKERMLGLVWPPCHEDFKTWLKLEHDEIRDYKRISTIEDDDIRIHVYFYNEVAQHTKRIKVLAALHELLGEPTEKTNVAHFWFVEYLSMVSLVDEATQLGMTEKAVSLSQCLQAFDDVGEMFVENLDDFFPITEEQKVELNAIIDHM